MSDSIRVVHFVYPDAAPAAAGNHAAPAPAPDCTVPAAAPAETNAPNNPPADADAAAAADADADADADVTNADKPSSYVRHIVLPVHSVFYPLFLYQSPKSFRIRPQESLHIRAGDVWNYCNALALSYRPRMATWNARQLTLEVKNPSKIVTVCIKKGATVHDVMEAVQGNYTFVCYKPLRSDRMSMKA
jgi:hypothetical protein